MMSHHAAADHLPTFPPTKEQPERQARKRLQALQTHAERQPREGLQALRPWAARVGLQALH
jgi:hypothetical protein